MFRMTRLTDYAILLLTHFAREPRSQRNARDLAAQARLPLPTVRKIVKILAHHGLLEVHRGVKGGFVLARAPEAIGVAEIIAALEGPIAITQCSEERGRCGIETSCLVRHNWRKINQVIHTALQGLTLAEMTRQFAGPVPVLVRR
jgi:FeS assembly SUF system regulator